VQHIHRVGRASRGGRSGWATNFYEPSSADLVESLLLAAGDEEVEEEVEGEEEERVESSNSSGSSSSSSSSSSEGAKKGSVEGSFSRRRGFRKRIKRQLAAAAQQLDGSNAAVIVEGITR